MTIDEQTKAKEKAKAKAKAYELENRCSSHSWNLGECPPLADECITPLAEEEDEYELTPEGFQIVEQNAKCHAHGNLSEGEKFEVDFDELAKTNSLNIKKFIKKIEGR